ncbi:MAG: SURF1 family protein [Gammaproteobacteria bacterium]|nr:SURF1 family protein [Gammaproteobacteria bacterium]
MLIGAYSFRPGLWPTVFTIVLLPLFLSLGFWQLERAGQKRVMHSGFIDRQAQEALLMNEKITPGAMDQYLWRKARANGRFDPARQILLDNQVVDGKPGYFVYTPLHLEAADQWILVNRGWIATGPDRNRVPEIGVTGEPVSLTGVLKPEPATGIVLREFPPEKMSEKIVRVQKLSLEELSAFLGRPLLPAVLRLDNNTEHGYLRNWTVPGSGEEKHLGYAFQWFCFAALLLILYIAVNLKKSKQ